MNNFQNENDTKQRKPFINLIWICQKNLWNSFINAKRKLQQLNFNYIRPTVKMPFRLFSLRHVPLEDFHYWFYIYILVETLFMPYFFSPMVLSYGHVFFHFDWHFWASCVIRIFVWKRNIPLKPKSLIKSNRKTFYVRHKSCVTNCSEERNIISGKGVTKLFPWIIKKRCTFNKVFTEFRSDNYSNKFW